MNKYLADMHTHTVASGHALNTIEEMAHSASALGLSMLGITEHTMTMPGTCSEDYFWELKNQIRSREGVELCFGAEANIIGYDGSIDISQELAKELDLVIASIHNTIGYSAGNREENTAAIIGAIKNPYVNIIGHPDDSHLPMNYDAIVLAAKEYHTLLEINNASLTPGGFRAEPRDNDITILLLCKKYDIPVILDSDAHSIDKIASRQYSMELVREVNFPDELIINYHPDRLRTYLNKYRKS